MTSTALSMCVLTSLTLVAQGGSTRRRPLTSGSHPAPRILQTTTWTALNGYVQTQYDLVCYMADDSYTEYGNLVIRTRVNPTTCVAGGSNPSQVTQTYKYTSGMVDTVGKRSVRNGRIEMNAKLPLPTFRVWPAGWAISTASNRDMGKCWPLSTEIDRA